MWPNDRQREPVRKWLPYSYRDDIEPPYILPEMIPRSMWGVNLRNLLSQAEWDRIRKDCYKKARYHCRVCGGKGEPPHCNEQWRFESAPEPSREGLQKLVRLACLCRACHQIKHLGQAAVAGRLDEAIAHMAKINRWTLDKARAVHSQAGEEWERRNLYRWTLDVSLLEREYGLIVKPDEENVRRLNVELVAKLEPTEKHALAFDHRHFFQTHGFPETRPENPWEKPAQPISRPRLPPAHLSSQAPQNSSPVRSWISLCILVAAAAVLACRLFLSESAAKVRPFPLARQRKARIQQIERDNGRRRE